MLTTVPGESAGIMAAPGSELEAFRALHELSIAVSSPLALDTIAEVAASHVCAMLEVDAARCYWWDDDAAALRRLGAGAPYAQHAEPLVEPVEGMLGIAFEKREPVVVNDYAAWEHASERGIARGLASAAVVPLVVTERVRGVLAVRCYSRHLFAAEQIEMLTRIAAVISPPFEAASLYIESERQRGDLEAIEAISRRISASLDLDQVLDAIVQCALDLVKADLSFLALTNSDGGLQIAAVAGNRTGALKGHVIPPGVGVGGRVMTTGQAFGSQEYLSDAGIQHAAASDMVIANEGIVWMVAVPIRRDGETVGVFWVAARGPRPFNKGEAALLERLSVPASAAIEHARVLAREQASRIEARALLTAAELLSGAAEPEDVLRRVVAVAIESINVKRVSYITNEGGFARVQQSCCDGVWSLAGTIIPLETSVCGWVIRNQQTFRSYEPGGGSLFVWHHIEPPKSLLCVPVRDHDGTVRGVLTLADRRDSKPFSDSDQQMAEGLAHHASVALERAELVTELRRSEERYRDLFDNANDVLFACDLSGHFTSVNRTLERMSGYSRHELLQKELIQIIAPNHRDQLRDRESHLLAGELVPPYELEIVTESGRVLPLEFGLRLIHDGKRAIGMQGIGRDISERKALEEQLQHQAFYDTLTGLSNRALFMDRLSHALRAASRRNTAVAVLFLDLDGFKLINDSLGHDAGDELLAAVGQRLAACLRPTDTLARFGGDEFTMLLDGVASPAEPLRVADRLLAALRPPFVLRQRQRFIGASVGIAWSGPQSTLRAPEDLLREADLALYQAKAQGKGRAVQFEASMSQQAVERLNLETDLRLALDRGEMKVYYQPSVEFATGKVVALEALVRWQHPLRGLLTPESFLSLAEESGVIVRLGWWVLGEACRQAQALAPLQPDGRPMAVSVNLSARQLQQTDLVAQVAAALAESGLEPGALKLEITESVAMQQGLASADTLQGLKNLGVRLAIDDFGTGYSSVSYLQRFPLDELKVHQSFIADLGAEGSSGNIVGAVIALARALGVQVAAEGTETREQVTRLQELGCSLGQGYYFSQPVPAGALPRLLGQVPDGSGDRRDHLDVDSGSIASWRQQLSRLLGGRRSADH